MRSASWWCGALCLCLLAPAGEAFGLVVFQEHFDSDLPNFASYSDWGRSYCSDNWRTDLNGGVIAGYDAGCELCGCNFLVQGNNQTDCISSDPFDNHIQNGNVYWQNYVFSVRFRNADDDSMGVVFRYNDSATFYLFVLSRDVAPAALSGCDEIFSGASLLRVRPYASPEYLAKIPQVTYTLNTIHAIEVAVQFNHVIIRFDANGDGSFSADEKIIDLYDDPAKTIPNGRIGLYAFQNGVQANGLEDPPPCGGKGCWFDDVKVEMLPATSGNCGSIGWEGICDGNTLKFCDATGKLQVKPCADNSCCRWVASESFYSCVPATQCGASCKDACKTGDKGCSANLDAKWLCGSGDADACKEPQFTPCPESSVCNPATGECQTVCIPACAGKECGPDDCDGQCGICSEATTCEDGKCIQSALGQFGDPCSGNDSCSNKMCVEVPGGKQICSKACAGPGGCPDGYECIEVLFNGNPVLACVPTGTCTPQCQGKQCGGDGCGDQCGACPDKFECVAALCKAQDGATCQAADECAGGLCIPFQSGVKCTGPCVNDEECPDGWSCAPWISASMPNICAPAGTMVAHKLCREIAGCVEGCPPANPACTANCFFLGSGQAQADYAGLWVCSETYCLTPCGNDKDCLQKCLLGDCFQEFAACYPGTTTCKQALDCMAGCSGSPDCTAKCYDDALPAAKKQLADLLDCLDLFCNEDSPPNCIAKAVTGPCADAYAACSLTCTPVCADKECGPDGCGGNCGPCKSGMSCKSGKCVADCVPICEGRECGDNGCGSLCGICNPGLDCVDGVCIDPTDPVIPAPDVSGADSQGPGAPDSDGVVFSARGKKAGCAAGPTGSLPAVLILFAFLALLRLFSLGPATRQLASFGRRFKRLPLRRRHA